MYGVLYAISVCLSTCAPSVGLTACSPRSSPRKIVGQATALSRLRTAYSASWSVPFSLTSVSTEVSQAPIIALYADLTTSAPIFISGAIFIVAGFIALLIPFEPRGKASL